MVKITRALRFGPQTLKMFREKAFACGGNVNRAVETILVEALKAEMLDDGFATSVISLRSQIMFLGNDLEIVSALYCAWQKAQRLEDGFALQARRYFEKPFGHKDEPEIEILEHVVTLNGEILQAADLLKE